jgi:plastocyanin
MKKLAIIFLFAAAAAATTMACSSSSDSPSTTGDSGATPAGNTVTVKSNQFVPPSLTIKAGETVTWTWAGGTHTVTSGTSCVSDKAYTSGLKSSAGDTFTHTYATPGTFEYFCEPHCASAGMKGTIIVQ